MKVRTLTTLAMTSAIAMGATLLTSCSRSNSSGGQDQLVECYGVGKNGADVPVMMTKGMCDKLPATKQVVVNANDYVECYGVAAAGKNDCATNSTACGGTASVDRAPAAWIAIPKGVCENLQGSKVGALAGTSKKSGS